MVAMSGAIMGGRSALRHLFTALSVAAAAMADPTLAVDTQAAKFEHIDYSSFSLSESSAGVDY